MSDAVDWNWQWLRAASAATLLALLALGLLLALAPAGVTVGTLQGGETAHTASELAAATNLHPGWALGFFLGDSLFVLFSAWFYVALARILSPPSLVRFFLIAGLTKVASDLVENILHLGGAIEVLGGGAWDRPPLDALYVLALLKRLAAAVAALAAAAGFPGTGGTRLVPLAFLLSALAAFCGFFLPAFNQGYAALFFVTLVLILWCARRVIRSPV